MKQGNGCFESITDASEKSKTYSRNSQWTSKSGK